MGFLQAEWDPFLHYLRPKKLRDFLIQLTMSYLTAVSLHPLTLIWFYVGDDTVELLPTETSSSEFANNVTCKKAVQQSIGTNFSAKNNCKASSKFKWVQQENLMQNTQQIESSRQTKLTVDSTAPAIKLLYGLQSVNTGAFVSHLFFGWIITMINKITFASSITCQQRKLQNKSEIFFKFTWLWT